MNQRDRFFLREGERCSCLMETGSNGTADEGKEPRAGTVEAWGRNPNNPIGGWYGLKKGFRGRFGMYVPPLMEEPGLVELGHNPKNNRMPGK